MPNSATERFARTYTPRTPDDSYDSLGDAVDSIVEVPLEKAFQRVGLTSGFASGVLYPTALPSGSRAGVQVTSAFKNGVLQQTLVPAPVQTDKLILSTVMAGGTLA